MRSAAIVEEEPVKRLMKASKEPKHLLELIDVRFRKCLIGNLLFSLVGSLRQLVGIGDVCICLLLSEAGGDLAGDQRRFCE
jgi:hypothetical protein